MSKATTIKEALKRWEEKNEQDSLEAEDIGLQFQWLPIEKMDSTLSTLKNCKKLSLSTNMIEKIVGINGMKNLTILSLARNNIKSLSGIEALGETLEELWISYNFIEKLKPIENMKALKVFYVANNLIKEWVEYSRINLATNIEDLLTSGNPLVEHMDEHDYRHEAMRRLVHIKKLDGYPCIRDV